MQPNVAKVQTSVWSSQLVAFICSRVPYLSGWPQEGFNWHTCPFGHSDNRLLIKVPLRNAAEQSAFVGVWRSMSPIVFKLGGIECAIDCWSSFNDVNFPRFVYILFRWQPPTARKRQIKEKLEKTSLEDQGDSPRCSMDVFNHQDFLRGTFSEGF